MVKWKRYSRKQLWPELERNPMKKKGTPFLDKRKKETSDRACIRV